MSEFFDNLFGKKPSPKPVTKPSPQMPAPRAPAKPSVAYQKGDVIGGKYEVLSELGKGGFGVVYLAFDRESQRLCALKTFKDEFLADARTRAEFKRELLLWVNLGHHPNIVSARWVSEVSGRLFVEMEYIAPDARGCVTLADHLSKAGGPLPIEQVLGWAVQLCAGMAYAHEHGITCHRDINPRNILVTSDGTLKVSDFGLAVAREAAAHGSKGRCGTPGYMAPEIYRGEAAGPASDLYSFGLVLWQMAKGDQFPPFHVRNLGYGDAYMEAVYQREMTETVPLAHGKLDAAIRALLDVDPEQRHALTLDEWQAEFEAMLGARWRVLDEKEKSAAYWTNKGGSLAELGKNEEALHCYDRAIAIDPNCATTWSNKGIALIGLGRFSEGVKCYEQALSIDSSCAKAWINMANALASVGRREEAVRCYSQALDYEPQNAAAWNNKGVALKDMGRYEEAIACYNEAISIDARNLMAWINKGIALKNLGAYAEAFRCYDMALSIDPLDTSAWINKGVALEAAGHAAEAVRCYDKALSLDPNCAVAWKNKALALKGAAQPEEVIKCFDKALASDPRFAEAWYTKANYLGEVDQHEEAVKCYEEAISIDSLYVAAWYNKALAEEKIGRFAAALLTYRKFLQIVPPQDTKRITYAQYRIRELEKR